MTTDDKTLTEQIARALSEVQGYGPADMHIDWAMRYYGDFAAAVLPIVAVEVHKAKAEALRAWASGVESQLDATTSEGIDLGEWGRGLRSGIQQAIDTADRIETGDRG